MHRYETTIELDEDWAELLEQQRARLRCDANQLITAAIKRYLTELGARRQP